MTIKVANSQHAAGIAEIYAPHVETGVSSFETVPPSAEDFSKRIVKTIEDTPWLVMTDQTKVTGYAYANKHRWRDSYRWANEVSVYVHPKYHRLGVGRRLYKSLFEILQEQNIHQALAGIVIPNDASVSFHKSLGFSEIAHYREIGYKFGKWWDTIWMQKMLDSTRRPEEPIAFGKLSPDRIAQILDNYGTKKG